ncbi:MAG: S-layer homology domain-containing protein [Ruminococcaceae bacterium]|nr:S-layer homology domain-containing protein [Oscillospiraceae bacterium]
MKKMLTRILTVLLIFTLTMTNSAMLSFAETDSGRKSAPSFKELSDEIDALFEMLDAEMTIFNFRSDYLRAELGYKLYDLCFTEDILSAPHKAKLNEYIEKLDVFRSRYQLIALNSVQTMLRNVVGFSDEELLSVYYLNSFATEDIKETLDKEYAEMAERKYGLVNINGIIPSEIAFSDINESAWYYEIVSEMTKLGLFKGKTEAVNGVSQFCPDDTITRAEFVAVLCRMIFPVIDSDDSQWHRLNIYTGETSPVSHKPWYADYVHMIQTCDMDHLGTGFFEFMNAPIKREEMAQLISRAVHLSRKWSFDAKSFENTDSTKLIPDFNEVNTLYKNGVKIAYLEKIIMGKNQDGYFDPKGYATRAEAAAVLYRFLKR